MVFLGAAQTAEEYPDPMITWILVACAAQEPHVGNIYQSGEEAHWRIEASGELIGAHWSRYRGEVELPGLNAHYFEAQVELRTESALGAVTQRYAGDLWTDNQGRPLHFVLQATTGKSYSRVELEFEDEQVAALVQQGSTARNLTVSTEAGALVLANNFISHFELLLALNPPQEGEKSTHHVFSPNVLRAGPISFQRIGDFETDTGDGIVSGVRLQDSLGEEIELSTQGRILSLEVKRAGIVFRRVDEPYEPFVLTAPERAPESREDLNEVDVRIPRGDVQLAGTLSRRKDLEGRLPAVFFVSGSGAQDRNGFSSGIDIGTHEVLDRLVREGFLVLRVDDRGTGESSARMTGASFDDLVADARACVDYLLTQKGTDPERVFVIGHSEGGVTAPLLAAQRPALAGIVLMAPSGRSIIDVLYEQNEAALRRVGELDEQALAETMVELRREMIRFCSEEELDPEELDENFRAMLPNRAWFQSHYRQDPIANIRAVRCPVLILHGELDFQVSPERDSRPLDRTLADAQHADHELHVFPGLDHLFKRAPGEVSEISDYFEDRRVDEGFLGVLVGWLKERSRE